MSAPRHLSWENFCSSIWHKGQQRTHRIGKSPKIDVFGDAINGRLGITIELKKKQEIPEEIAKLAFIQCRIFPQGGKHFLELHTASDSLRRQFYQFATAVADRILLENTEPIAATVAELKCFDELLAPRSLLSIEKQIGLIGELTFLNRLLDASGPGGIIAWVGPVGEPHDFRIGKQEIEVKTSSGTRRIHRIHGLEQLFPSTGMRLALVSILLEPAGKSSGFSLNSLIQQTVAQLKKEPQKQKRLKELLTKVGWQESDSKYYTRQWRLRRPIVQINVDDKFPRIGRLAVATVLGPLASRIDRVEYDVNMEGLGSEKSSGGLPNLNPKGK